MSDRPNQANEELEHTSQDAGQRSAAAHHNPALSLEKTRNASDGEGPNAAGGVAPSTAEKHVKGRSDEESSDLPSAR